MSSDPRARRGGPRRRWRHARLAAAGLVAAPFALAALGEYFTSDGVPPPLDAFYYPTGLLVSPGRTTLYVTNSDFDLQYSGGTIFALDLAKLRDGKLDKLVAGLNPDKDGKLLGAAEACSAIGLTSNDNSTLYPGPCSPFALPGTGIIDKAVPVGAFTSGAAMALRPCERGARLFIPVRGDPSVTFFDVTDDRGPEDFVDCPAAPAAQNPTPCGSAICLSCGSASNGGRCTTDHLVGKDPAKSQRNLTLPIEPYGIAVDSRGESVITAHQTETAASLIVNCWGPDGKNGCSDALPTLSYVTASLPSGPTEVAALPVPALIEEAYRSEATPDIDYQPAFGLSFRAAPTFVMLRYQSDAASRPPRPFITRSVDAGVSVVASSVDSRGLAIDGSERKACERTCPGTPTGDAAMDPTRAACLRSCAEKVPLRVYMGNRNPAALVLGEIETHFSETSGANGPEVTGAYDVPRFTDSVPLAYGTSRVAIGHVIDTEGKPAVRIFAVTFDSRLIFSYDPEAHRVDAVIHTGRGPQAVAFDASGEPGKEHSYMYVAHFTDSYLGVVDLDMRHPMTFGQMVLTVGRPLPPKESQ
jgi:hypothetical protein